MTVYKYKCTVILSFSSLSHTLWLFLFSVLQIHCCRPPDNKQKPTHARSCACTERTHRKSHTAAKWKFRNIHKWLCVEVCCFCILFLFGFLQPQAFQDEHLYSFMGNTCSVHLNDHPHLGLSTLLTLSSPQPAITVGANT